MFRKRNKIKLPLPDSVGGNSETNQSTSRNKIKSLSLNLGDEDEDNELDLVPIKLKKNRNKIVLTEENSVPNADDIDYKNELIRNRSAGQDNPPTMIRPEGRIMNMEDIEEEEVIELGSEGSDNNSYIFPSREEIENIKEKKSRSRNKYLKGHSEKDYIKLLDTDDKLELMETINKNGGVHKKNDKMGTLSDDNEEEFDDGRLAITENQRIDQESKKREFITEALNEKDMGKDWENHVLTNVANLDTELMNEYQLPMLWDDPREESDDDVLESLINQLDLDDRKVSLQIRQIQKEEENLLIEKSKLLEALKKLMDID